MYYEDGSSSAAALVAAGALFLFFAFIGIVTYVIISILLMMIFKKAGVEGWKAWVPYYNNWVWFELSGYKGWLSIAPIGIILALNILSVIPIIGLLFALLTFPVALAIIALNIIVMLNFQKALDKEWGWIFLYIFLPVVWMAVIAFDSSKYEKEKLGSAFIKGLGINK